jgi:DNA invertase Pin-like site-specific DNA recombinase
MTRLCIIPRSALSAYCSSLQYAEFEHEILRERIRAGIAEAKLKGKRFGRPLTAAKKTDQIRKLYRAGISKAEIARRLEIGRTSVRRILRSPRA